MLFNSFQFLVFLPVVFLLYWFVFSKSKVSQNIFLLLVSYLFYSFWDWRFSFLLAFSTVLDFYSGSIIHNTNDRIKKKMWMRLSIFINIGLLCYFKYLNFFIDSFTQILTTLNFEVNTKSLEIILPIGISFYTFHGVSYVMDIYYGRIPADKNIIDYSLFVSFFPLLVAGPIERATHLLPQLKRRKEFNYQQAVEGCRLILWGMFKKVVVADSLAPLVDAIFNNYQNESGVTLILGAVAFSFQVYGDFSGYTDIARGVSKLLGIELILNFNFPFFSKSIPEFWSRWHISLSSWLNDYVFTPIALSFRDYKKWGVFLAVFLTFTIAGLWHGANWNFVAYGMLNGLYFIPYIFSKKGIRSITSNKKSTKQIRMSDLPSILLTFILFSFSLIFFRSESLGASIGYIQKIVSDIYNQPTQILSAPIINAVSDRYFYLIIMLIFVSILYDWQGRLNNHIKSKRHNFVYIFVGFLIILGLLNGDDAKDFIYFQF